MLRSTFIKKYKIIALRAFICSEKARREGLLALEEEFSDRTKYMQRDIFDYGMKFVIDGTDAVVIEQILNNIINQEKNKKKKILKTIQKEAALSIQRGDNPRILLAYMNSYTDIDISGDEVIQEFLKS